MSNKKVDLQNKKPQQTQPKTTDKKPVNEEETTVVKEQQAEPTVISEQPAKKTNNFISIKRKQLETTDDSMSTRKYAWLAYIMFFIPLLINKTSKFVRFNANEGLKVNIIDAIGVILIACGAAIKTNSVAGQSILVICLLVGIFLLVLTTITRVYMITVAAQGKTSRTPWFFHITMIK